MNTQVCRVCGKEKPVDHFNKDSTKKLGIDNRCKECFSEYKKEYRQREYVIIKQREYRKKIGKKLKTKRWKIYLSMKG